MIQGSRGSAANYSGTFLSTLSERVSVAVKEGYTDNFKMTRQGLCSGVNHKTYKPAEVKIVDFCRFEGESDPSDNEILYVIETSDGDKGLLIDAYGPYADEYVNNFITQVKAMCKK